MNRYFDYSVLVIEIKASMSIHSTTPDRDTYISKFLGMKFLAHRVCRSSISQNNAKIFPTWLYNL